MAQLDGHCLCGAVTVRAEAQSTRMTACNCRNCRRWTGGVAFNLAVVAETAEIAGPVKTIAPMPWAERGFCADCGSPVFYRITAEGEMNGLVKVAAGLFDDLDGMTLETEFYADERPGVFDLSRPHKQMTRAEVEAHFFGAGQGETQ